MSNNVLENLINERNQFENYIYDNLILDNEINEINEINQLEEINEINISNIYTLNRNVFRYTQDPTFWDPVIVNLSIQQIDNLEYIYNSVPLECIICNDLKKEFRKVGCCNNNICYDCTDKWFSLSVYCPFCKKDQREI